MSVEGSIEDKLIVLGSAINNELILSGAACWIDDKMKTSGAAPSAIDDKVKMMGSTIDEKLKMLDKLKMPGAAIDEEVMMSGSVIDDKLKIPGAAGSAIDDEVTMSGSVIDEELSMSGGPSDGTARSALAAQRARAKNQKRNDRRKAAWQRKHTQQVKEVRA